MGTTNCMLLVGSVQKRIKIPDWVAVKPIQEWLLEQTWNRALSASVVNKIQFAGLKGTNLTTVSNSDSIVFMCWTLRGTPSVTQMAKLAWNKIDPIPSTWQTSAFHLQPSYRKNKWTWTTNTIYWKSWRERNSSPGANWRRFWDSAWASWTLSWKPWLSRGWWRWWISHTTNRKYSITAFWPLKVSRRKSRLPEPLFSARKMSTSGFCRK